MFISIARPNLAVQLVFLLALLAFPSGALAQDPALPSPGPKAITGSSDTSSAGDTGTDTTLLDPITIHDAVEKSTSSTGKLLADADGQESAGAAVTNNLGKSGIKKRTLGQILKSNIIETFQLDPRLKKDLTEGDPMLRPVRLTQDYFAVGYNPVITWTRTGSATSQFLLQVQANNASQAAIQADLAAGIDPFTAQQDGFNAAQAVLSGNPGSGSGGKWLTDYSKRNMSLYVVGPVTKHLSGWFQMTPLLTPHGFFQHYEVFQGMANYGNDKTFVQIRGGQGFNWENAGWGGADRTITQTFPGVYTAFNGFDPTAFAKTVSLEATGLNWTTGKVFGYWQPAAGTTTDPNISYHRGYGMGLVLEKLIGRAGISGIQSNFTIGNTPAFNAAPDVATSIAINTANVNLQGQANLASQTAIANDLANGVDPDTAAADGAAAAAAVIAAGPVPVSGNPIGTQPSPFIWWNTWINKSFQDKKGNVRANPSFGLTLLHLRRFLDDPTLPENRATGYGYTFDLMTVPVTSYWSNILRFDQFRTSDLTHKNTTYTFTVGNAIDFHMPDKGRMRVTLDYQYVVQNGIAPTHRLILAFWPIW